MMSPARFKLLKETYAGKSRQARWDEAHGCVVHDKPERLSEAEWASLVEGPLPPNAIETHGHDALVTRLQAAARALPEAEVLEGFVQGCSGAWDRGRQTPISLAYARHLPTHAFQGDADTCALCGLPREARFDRTELVFRLYWGYAWNEMPWNHLADLEEWPSAARPPFAEADHQAFRSLLQAIDAAPEGEPPSKLERRLAKAGLPCRMDKYRRYGVLLALGELGVLPNAATPPAWERFVGRAERQEADARLGRSHRSDVVLPLSAWSGGQRVRWDRVAALFPGLA